MGPNVDYRVHSSSQYILQQWQPIMFLDCHVCIVPLKLKKYTRFCWKFDWFSDTATEIPICKTYLTHTFVFKVIYL
jgi:hypothetical protein